MQHKRGEASASDEKNDELSPELKRARLQLHENSSRSPSDPLSLTAPTEEDKSPTRWLIRGSEDDVLSKLPISLCNGATTKIGQDLDRLRTLLNTHGLRTSTISSPRAAVSIYKESCRIDRSHDNSDVDASFRDGKEFLLITFGLHPQQEKIEQEYEAFAKKPYCVLLFCRKLLQEYSNLQQSSKEYTSTGADEDLQRLLGQIELTLRSVHEYQHKTGGSGISSRSTQEKVNALIELAAAVRGKRRYRKEEWRKEYQRISVSNSTISNAYMYLLQSYHGMCIKDVYLKFNKQQPKYERITIYLYDPAIDYRRPDLFLFLPGLRTMVTKGPEALVSEMIDSFWTFVIRKGYFPPLKLQRVLDGKLQHFFLAGITPSSPISNGNLPLPLRANFVPTIPFSIYLHGKAGAGMVFARKTHFVFSRL